MINDIIQARFYPIYCSPLYVYAQIKWLYTEPEQAFKCVRILKY
jgi:hypothetical protein